MGEAVSLQVDYTKGDGPKNTLDDREEKIQVSGLQEYSPNRILHGPQVASEQGKNSSRKPRILLIAALLAILALAIAAAAVGDSIAVKRQRFAQDPIGFLNTL